MSQNDKHPVKLKRFLVLCGAVSLPIITIFVLVYIQLDGMAKEIPLMAHVYGKFLLKEQLTHHLVSVAEGMEILQIQGLVPEGEEVTRAVEHIFQSALCAGIGQYLIAVNMKDSRILYPAHFQGSRMDFLEDVSKKQEFMRMIEEAARDTPIQGYLCQNSSNGKPSPSVMWYVSAIRAGEDLALVTLFPEDEVRVAGDSLVTAQQELIRSTCKRLLLYVLATGLGSAALIGYIFSRREEGGRER